MVTEEPANSTLNSLLIWVKSVLTQLPLWKKLLPGYLGGSHCEAPAFRSGHDLGILGLPLAFSLSLLPGGAVNRTITQEAKERCHADVSSVLVYPLNQTEKTTGKSEYMCSLP